MNQENIIPHQHHINKFDRNQLKNHKGVVIWFTGLSGSGKSTLASEMESKLFEKGIHTYILDGDNIRTGLNKGLTFSEEDRQENIRRIGEVAKLMVDAGLVVLTAFISPFISDRQMVRNLVADDEFIEVFVDCPLEICEQRDVKGLYKKARAGAIKHFTGIDSPFEKPEKPEITISTHLQPLAESVTMLLGFTTERMKLR